MTTSIGIMGLILLLMAIPSLILGLIQGIGQFVLSPIKFLATYPIF